MEVLHIIPLIVRSISCSALVMLCIEYNMKYPKKDVTYSGVVSLLSGGKGVPQGKMLGTAAIDGQPCCISLWY